MRHYGLALILLGTLFLPLAEWGMPSWAGPLFTVQQSSETLEVGEVNSTAESMPWALDGPLEKAGRVGTKIEKSAQFSGEQIAPTLPVESKGMIVEEQGLFKSMSLDWSALGLGLWVLGTSLLLLRFVSGVLQVKRTVQRATPLSHPRLDRAMKETLDRLGGLNHRLSIRESSRTEIPFAWGWNRPVVLLPDSWQTWDDRCLTAVLVHEAAHLKRRDGLALWMGRLATALWWFHPLVWILDHWARAECERATDDAVLSSGEKASQYAENLLSIGRSLRRPQPLGVSLTMLNQSNLKRRVLAILHPNRLRSSLNRSLAAIVGIPVLLALVVLAGTQFVGTVEADAFSGNFPQDSFSVVQDDEGPGGDEKDKTKGKKKKDSRKGYEAGDSHWETAYDAYKSGHFETAASSFLAAADRGYKPATSTYNAACSHALNGDKKAAMEALQLAIDRGFDDLDLLVEDDDLHILRSENRFQSLVNRAYQDAGEERHDFPYRDLQDRFEIMKSKASKDADEWYEVGTELLMMREFDGARYALGQAARLDPDGAENAFYNLACTEALAGKKNAALENLTRAIYAGYDSAKHMKKDPDLKSLRGEETFKKLVKLAYALDLDRFRKSWWEKAKDTLKGDWNQNEYSEEMWAPAVEFYEDFTAKNQKIGVGWFNYGYSLHYSKRFDESVAMFKKAEKLGFKRSTSAYNVACGYSMMHKVDDAMTWLEKSVDSGVSYWQIKHDDDLDNLRAEPRFKDLMVRLKAEEKEDHRHEMKKKKVKKVKKEHAYRYEYQSKKEQKTKVKKERVEG